MTNQRKKNIPSKYNKHEDKRFPERIAELLDREDVDGQVYSMTSLSVKLDVTRQTIGQWKNGVTAPTVPALIKLAELYAVPTDWILGLIEMPAQDEDYQAVERVLGITDPLTIEKLKSIFEQNEKEQPWYMPLIEQIIKGDAFADLFYGYKKYIRAYLEYCITQDKDFDVEYDGMFNLAYPEPSEIPSDVSIAQTNIMTSALDAVKELDILDTYTKIPREQKEQKVLEMIKAFNGLVPKSYGRGIGLSTDERKEIEKRLNVNSKNPGGKTK